MRLTPIIVPFLALGLSVVPALAEPSKQPPEEQQAGSTSPTPVNEPVTEEATSASALNPVKEATTEADANSGKHKPTSPSPDTAPRADETTPASDLEPSAKATAEDASEDEQLAKPGKTPLEKPSPRQGHYIALGLHGTAATVNDPDRGRRGPAIGVGFSLRLGERITNRLDLGVELAYARIEGDTPWTFGRLSVHARGYLTKETFVHAGFGFGAAGGVDPEDPDFSRGRFGDVYTLGAGHNFYLSDGEKSGGWLVSPVVTAEYGRDDKFPNAGLWIGVEISRWWGIPRNQLDLDFDEAYKRR